MQKIRFKIVIIILLTISVSNILHAQEPDSLYNTADSLSIDSDSVSFSRDRFELASDSVNIDSLARKSAPGSDVESNVVYNAKDSVVFAMDGGAVELYGEASITYEEIELKAGYIRYETENNLVVATGLPDSTGEMANEPIFTEGESSFESRESLYWRWLAFKNKKSIKYRNLNEEKPT